MADSDPLDTGPFDPDELVEWAESYGHPEGWAKRAQEAHGRAEKAEAEADDKEREAAMARHNEGVNRECAERAEARLAEALAVLQRAYDALSDSPGDTMGFAVCDTVDGIHNPCWCREARRVLSRAEGET